MKKVLLFAVFGIIVVPIFAAVLEIVFGMQHETSYPIALVVGGIIITKIVASMG